MNYQQSITNFEDMFDFPGATYYPPSYIITGNLLKMKHSSCSFKIRIKKWPKGYESICLYQFCNLFHKIIYGKCRKKCNLQGKICECIYLQQKFFVKNDSVEDYVLDSKGEDQLCYETISKKEFDNGKRIIFFSDYPTDCWNLILKIPNEKNFLNYSLDEIVKKQTFKLFLAGHKEHNQIDRFRNWQWGFDMLFSNGKPKENPKRLVETQEMLPKHLINLPNANYCMHTTKPSTDGWLDSENDLKETTI